MKDLWEEYRNLSSIGQEVEMQGIAKESGPLKSPRSTKSGAMLEKQIQFYLHGIADVFLNMRNVNKRIIMRI